MNSKKLHKIPRLGILLLLTALAFIYFFLNPSEVNFFPKCPLYTTTGIYCPGCGSQRATHHLLNFNFLGAIHQNVLFFSGMVLAIYYTTISVLNYFFKRNIYNYLNHPKTPIVILILVVLFWVLRNLPYYPFTWLAPN